MSGLPVPPTKLSLSERLRKSFKLRSSGSSRSPASLVTQAFTSSTAQSPGSSSTQILTSSPPSAGLVAANSPSVCVAVSSPQQATSYPSPSFNLLDDALKRLSDRDRATLREYILPTSSDIDLALEQVLAAAKEKQRCCVEKRWKVTFAGRVFILNKEADKVICWLNRVKDIGDVVVNVDPVHAGLPWAGIRLLLEAAVSEANQMASLLVGCEFILYMSNRLKAYMDFLHVLPATLTRTNLEAAMTRLYAHILHFLAQAIQIYQTSILRRALSAFWNKSDVHEFEQACHKLGIEVHIEASNCNWEGSEELKRNLQRVLEELKKVHNVQESLNQLEIKLDLVKLPCVKGAMFDSYGGDHEACHPATRIDLLRQIQDWAQHPQSKNIFWLNGMAGTGKSTISWTIAKWFTDQGCHGAVDLGASFFFKRGEGDRASASQFFPTIIRQLMRKISGLDSLVAETIDFNPDISTKLLGEQFNKLIYEPLQKVNIPAGGCSTFIVVVDALDECEKKADIGVILDLWSLLPQIPTVRLKLFLTSRPDLPILQKFKKISADTHHDMILHDEVPRKTIQHDISTFLTDAFSKIREDYNFDPPSGVPLDVNWPGDKAIQALVDMAIPLFIVAATVCRYVGDSNFNPQERLEDILQFQRVGQLEQLERTYLPVLTQLPAMLSNSHDKKKLYQEFRMIVGSIIVLAEPLSVTSLAVLLDMRRETIVLRLRPLQSVLRVPVEHTTPVRTLHLSFNEFLLSDKLRDQPFGVNGPESHQILLTKCLELLSGSHGLRENICDLSYPGQPRKELDSAIIHERLSPELQYACQYWVHHAKHCISPICDNDKVHIFLQKHFLHWLEALSLLNRIAEVIRYIGVLQSLISANNSTHLSSFLEDAQRIVLANRSIADFAPLQIYLSAMIFAPQTSVVRNVCGRISASIRRYPITPKMWSLELQKLEGHTSAVNAVAFSQDGSMLASASRDKTVRLWNPTTGQEVQKLEGHTLAVNAVAFSQDSSLLASASWDRTVRVWNPTTGQEVQKLEGHADGVNAVAFSQDGSLLASASRDETVRVWNPITGQEIQKLEGHTDGVSTVAFSRDGSLLASGSEDETVRLWNPTTGQEVQKLERCTHKVSAVAFSRDGSLLASASLDNTVRLWNPTTGQEVQKLEGHIHRVSAVAFSQDGSLLASASWDETVRVWNPTTGQAVQKLEGHTEQVKAVAFSQDGSLLASASEDKTVRLWNPITVQEIRKLEGHTQRVSAVAFSRDGSLLASASLDKTVRLWNPIMGQEVQKLEGHTGEVIAAAFSQDGSLLASASRDETVRVWNPITGQEIQKLEGHTDGVNTVAFSRDGSLLASGSWDGTVRVWNLTIGQEVQKLEGHTSIVDAVAFSQDGSLLASSSWTTVRLWNPTTGQEVQKLEGHTDDVSAVAFSQDGLLLASASRDETVRLWNPNTGKEVQKFENQPNIRTISFMVDQNILLTNRGTISLDSGSIHSSTLESSIYKTSMVNGWIQQNNRNTLWLPQEYRSYCSAFFGNTLAIGLHSGQVSFFQFDSS